MSKDKRRDRDRADALLRRVSVYGQALNCKWGLALTDKRIQAALKRGWIQIERYGPPRCRRTVAKITEAGQRRLEERR